MRLLRPQFLVAGLALNILGSALAVHLGASIDIPKFLTMQLVISSCQLAGAVVNEYADAATDRVNRNRTWFSGGSGVFASGEIDRRSIIILAAFWTAAAVSGIEVLTFAFGTGLPLMLVMLLGLFLALAYSLGPFKLAYRGLGELAMAVMVSMLAPAAAFMVQAGAWDSSVLAVFLPLAFQMMGLMMVVEYPDVEADAAAGKRNLVVRLGRSRAWTLGVAMLVLGGVSALISSALGILTTASTVVALILLTEALAFTWMETTVSRKPAYFWSTAGTSGFYVLAIVASAAVLYGL